MIFIIRLSCLGPDHLELINFVIINKKIDNHPSRLITAKIYNTL